MSFKLAGKKGKEMRVDLRTGKLKHYKQMRVRCLSCGVFYPFNNNPVKCPNCGNYKAEYKGLFVGTYWEISH